MPYTSNKNGNNDHGLGTITDSHIPLTGLSNFWFPPNVDFHSGQQQQFLRPSQEPPGLHPSTSQAHNLGFKWIKSQPFIQRPSFFLTFYGPVFPSSLIGYSVWSLSGSVDFGDTGNICSSVLILVKGLDTRIWSWILIWLLEMAIIKLEVWLLQWV